MGYDYDLISIGSGSAGRRVSVAMKRKGWKVAIIEADVEGHFGGTCICSGCIPTKALVEKIDKTGDFELAKDHKKLIVERIRGGTLRSARDRVGVDIISGFASFIDNHTLVVDSHKYTSDIIVIATGSQPFIPPIRGLNSIDYMTSTQVLNLEDLPKSILLIGGGRIGLELGLALHKLGVSITIFEGLPQILPGEDKEMTELIEQLLMKKGIEIYKNRFVDEVTQQIGENGETEYLLHLEDGPHKGVYKGDMVFVATGRYPRTSQLKIENTGVRMDRAAIMVDEYFQTSVDNIYAIGDVIGNPMFTNWASYHSGVLLKNFTVSKVKTADWLPMPKKLYPAIAFIDPELASVGMTEEKAREMYGDEVVVYKFQNKWLGKSMIVDDWDGVLKGVGRKGSNEILGAHLWGKRTGSLIQMIVLAMENNLGWAELSDMVYGHPVLAEGIYSLASNMKNLTLN